MTRQLVITQNITLDGVVEALDWFSVHDDVEQTDLLEHTQELMADEAAMLLGRVTFEDMRGYWPAQTDDTTGITAQLNGIDKYVVSTTLTDPEWANSTVLTGGDALTQQVRDVLADGPDGDVVVTGSIRLCHDLFAAGLVDGLRLYVYPVVYGEGRRLYPDGVRLPGLELRDSRAFRSGVTMQHYRLR